MVKRKAPVQLIRRREKRKEMNTIKIGHLTIRKRSIKKTKEFWETSRNDWNNKRTYRQGKLSLLLLSSTKKYSKRMEKPYLLKCQHIPQQIKTTAEAINYLCKDDQFCKAFTVYAFVRTKLKYIPDPKNQELIRSPSETLKLEGEIMKVSPYFLFH